MKGITGEFTVAPNIGNTGVDSDPNTVADFVDPTLDAVVIPPVFAVGDYTWLDAVFGDHCQSR
jgi:hypothetical protein